jgi:hypothetical protein
MLDAQEYTESDQNGEEDSFDLDSFNPDGYGSDTNRMPYLFVAIELCHASTACALVRCGASADRCYAGYSALFLATLKNANSVLACMLNPEQKHYAAWQAVVNWYLSGLENTALHHATANNNFAAAVLLLAAGANPLLLNSASETPSMFSRHWSMQSVYTRVHLINAEEKQKKRVKHRVHVENYFDSIGEWRPRRHTMFPLCYRRSLRVLVILAKA